MDNFPDPEEIFSDSEIKRLKKWISYYRKSDEISLKISTYSFFGVLILFVLLIVFGILPHFKIGISFVEWIIICCILGTLINICIRIRAEWIFKDYDRRFYKKSNLNEYKFSRHYEESVIDDIKIRASRELHDFPTYNSNEITIDNFVNNRFSKDVNMAEVHEYEDYLFQEWKEQEHHLKFKAYIARIFGLNVPSEVEWLKNRYNNWIIFLVLISLFLIAIIFNI